jgi:hypothetical protein
MILNGNERGNAGNLSRHLLNTRDNDHVELHELRGFVADDLHGALQECEAVAMGTRCQNHLFSLSLSPPEFADVAIDVFEDAIARIEGELGLDDQPRAIVFHEKEGRRHAHAVWSKVDGAQMKAINLSFYKRKLTAISKQLFLEQGWPMPEGLRDPRMRDPLKFTLEDWQKAKRTGLDPQQTKALLRECWNISDSQESFEAALREKGFWLAHGDRRNFIAVNWKGEVHSLSRACGAKVKEFKSRLGDPHQLRSVDETKAFIGALLTPKLKAWAEDAHAKAKQASLTLQFQREQIVERHRKARAQMKDAQQTRRIAEEQMRAARTPRGLRGLWGWISGKNRKIRQFNEAEIGQEQIRDRAERHALIQKQLMERRALQRTVVAVRKSQRETLETLFRDIAHAMSIGRVPDTEQRKPRTRNRDLQRGRDRDGGPDFNQ